MSDSAAVRPSVGRSDSNINDVSALDRNTMIEACSVLLHTNTQMITVHNCTMSVSHNTVNVELSLIFYVLTLYLFRANSGVAVTLFIL